MKGNKGCDTLINTLAKNTAKIIIDNTTDYEDLSKLLSNLKHREYSLLSKEDLIEIFEYAFKAIYGESAKLIIILLIAYSLNIFVPVVIVATVFVSLRTIAGGFHMDSFMKCLISTASLFIIPTYLVQKLISIHSFDNIELVLITIVTYILCYWLAHKYAPKDNPNKLITDINKIKELKKKTKAYLTIIGMISLILILILHNPTIILFICVGQLAEIYTITPMSVIFCDN
jgi:accessory gene regulator B